MITRIARTIAVVVSSVALSLVSATSGTATTTSGTADPGTFAVPSPGGGHYAVTLTEMKISVPYAFFPAGQVTFDVTNAGTSVHELVVIRTDTYPSSIGMRATDPTKADEKGSIGEIEDLAPGTTQSLTLTLTPGRYALICNMPGHFMAGMRTGFTAATYVNVTLKEMLIGLDTAVVPAGPVVFMATNAGGVTHELVVLKTDLAPGAIPARTTDSTKAQEPGNAGEIQDIDAARFSGGAFDLTPGKYVLICNEPGHYMAGMRTGFLVQ